MGRGKKKNKGHIISTRADTIPHAIAQALRELEQFPDIKEVSEPVPIKNGWTVGTIFSVPLPTRATATGISATRVKVSEEVFFLFPENYPRRAPQIRLRKDFPRNLPHIFPGSENDFVAPCIYDGPLDDLLHQGMGLTEILYQIQDWLRKAASNSLINNKQGWEPIRYDTIACFIVYEHFKLRSLVTEKADTICLACIAIEKDDFSRYRMSKYTPYNFDERYARLVTQNDENKGDYFLNIRPVLFSWPHKDKIVDEYFPETVTNLGELINRTKQYGTYLLFWQQIQMLWNRMLKYGEIKEIITIQCVRRPLPLINQNTKLELLAYKVRVKFGALGVPDMDSPVDIVGHLHAVGPEVLKELSGSLPTTVDSIIQIGCGSLGSKIALHLARAGHGPLSLVDGDYLSEHNLARHALTKTSGNKAEVLAKEIGILNIEAKPYPKSIHKVIDKNENKLFEKNNLIIDSTASINVREALASLPVPSNNSRIFQTGLYSEGRIGFITIEGEHRNPRIDDLSAAIFNSAIDNKDISKSLMNSDDSFRRQATGQGCGSFTMVIPDTKISMYAAAMAERARKAVEGNLQVNGEILLGHMAESGMSLTWDTISLGKTHIVKLDNKEWELRVLASAYDAMGEEVQKHPSVETGGVLIGRLSFARKCAIITRALEGPSDSVRTSGRFELGVEGLVDKVAEIQETSGLTYLGTWHSHLYGSSPSGIDEAALRKIKSLRLGIPAFNLIWHNGRLTCFADYGDY